MKRQHTQRGAFFVVQMNLSPKKGIQCLYQVRRDGNDVQ